MTHPTSKYSLKGIQWAVGRVPIQQMGVGRGAHATMQYQKGNFGGVKNQHPTPDYMGWEWEGLEPGVVILVDFLEHERFDKHPAVIIEIHGKDITVASATSQSHRKNEVGYFPISKGQGGMRKDGFVDYIDLKIIEQNEIVDIWAKLDDEIFQQLLQNINNLE